MTEKTYPSNVCSRHGVQLVDVLEDNGSISRACQDCVPGLGLVDVVRQLHQRAPRKEAT